jgi:hypothetical protein
MALNRYLYPQKGTNIVQEAVLATRVNIASGGAVGAIAVGRGLTVAPTGTPGEYTVTINDGSVSDVVGVNVQFVCAYDKTKHTSFHVVSVSSTGCTIQAFRQSNGDAAAVDADGTLFVELICTLSSVTA